MDIQLRCIALPTIPCILPTGRASTGPYTEKSSAGQGGNDMVGGAELFISYNTFHKTADTSPSAGLRGIAAVSIRDSTSFMNSRTSSVSTSYSAKYLYG